MALNMYKVITDRIIDSLQKGEIPWDKPWVNTCGTACAISHNDGRTYSLLNQLLLGMPGEYATFLQIQKEGGKVKKGAKAQIIVYTNKMRKEKLDKEGKPVLDADGNPEYLSIPFLKYSNVFILDDTEGVEKKYVKSKPPISEEKRDERIEKAVEDYLNRTNVTLRNIEQNRSYYSVGEDEIVLPKMSQFKNSEAYYAALFHELAHSTAPRLKRNLSSKEEAYSKEELVAEISSAVLCNHFGISTEALERNTTAYLQGWIKALNEDTKMLAWAAGQAERAVKLILNVNDKEDAANETA